MKVSDLIAFLKQVPLDVDVVLEDPTNAEFVVPPSIELVDGRVEITGQYHEAVSR